MSDLRKEVLALMLLLRTMEALWRERVLRAIKDDYFDVLDDIMDDYPHDPLYGCVKEEYNRRING